MGQPILPKAYPIDGPSLMAFISDSVTLFIPMDEEAGMLSGGKGWYRGDLRVTLGGMIYTGCTHIGVHPLVARALIGILSGEVVVTEDMDLTVLGARLPAELPEIREVEVAA